MILVTGDVLLDHHIYAGHRLTPDSDSPHGTSIRSEPGGALFRYRLLEALSPQLAPPSQDASAASSKNGGAACESALEISFGLKQIAGCVFGSANPVLEFNLSQFDDPQDLLGAFHQVRDKALAGHTPIVFWDEFDCRNSYWLQFLLAPMQDGAFQEGQISHNIGKCVFVFAGGTSRDFAHFGPPDIVSQSESEPLRKVRNDFVMAKGPDFKSRLAGFLDVLGPNPRQCYDSAAAASGLHPWVDDPSDLASPCAGLFCFEVC